MKDLLSNVGSGGGAAAPAAGGAAATGGAAAAEEKEEEKPEGQFYPSTSINTENHDTNTSSQLQRRRSQTMTWDSVSSIKRLAFGVVSTQILFPFVPLLSLKDLAWKGQRVQNGSLHLFTYSINYRYGWRL